MDVGKGGQGRAGNPLMIQEDFLAIREHSPL